MPNTLQPKSFREVLGLWPQISDAAQDLGLKYDAVAQWVKRDSIPVAYWPRLINAAAARGFKFVSLPILVELAEQRAEKRRKAVA